MVQQLLVAAFIVAHGLIHLGFVSARPAPAPGAPPWPFDLASGPAAASGRISPERLASLGRTLVLVVLVGYALAALGALGMLGETAFPTGLVIGSVASLGLLIAGYHRWLTVGIIVDVGLLAIAVSGWQP